MKKIEINKIYNLNCIEGMNSIPKNKIDLVITDPPFAINFKAKKANYNRTSSRVLSGYTEIKPEDYYDFSFTWMSEVFRILKDSGSMYVFSGWNNLKDILRALDDVGFITINHVIWKYQFGVVTKKKFVTSHYHCLYVCKNDKKRKFFPFSRFKKDEKTKERLFDKLYQWAKSKRLTETKQCYTNKGDQFISDDCEGEWSDPDGQDLAPIKDSTVAVEIVLGLNYSYNMFFADYKVDDPRHDTIKDWFGFFYKRVMPARKFYWGNSIGWYMPNIFIKHQLKKKYTKSRICTG